MPMKSKAQRRFLYANEPEVAKEFERETPKGKQLPEHVSDRREPKKGKSKS